MFGGIKRRGLGLLIASALALGVIGLPDAEAAFLYWANGDSNATGTIGRANPDGTGVNNSFFSTGVGPCSVAADTQHVYWTGGSPTGYVGRSSLLTGAVENQFAKATSGLPCGVAVGAAAVYFVNHASPGMATIGRVNLDGSGANTTFIVGASNPQMPAVNGSHIYWVNKDTNQVGRANLDGTGVNQGFIPTKCTPVGVALDATYVYWANTFCGSIGRARLDGTEVNQDFILLKAGACGLAVGGGSIYWANYGSETKGSIGRAGADGSGINESFIVTAGKSCGVAYGPDPAGPPAPPPPPAIGFKFVSVSCAKACAKILVKLRFDTAGEVRVVPVVNYRKTKPPRKIPSQIRGIRETVGSGFVTLRLKPTKAGKEAIVAKDKVKAKMRFTFTPNGGAATSLTQKIVAKTPKPKRR